MKQVLLWGGGLVVGIGVLLMLEAYSWPERVDMADASAIQATQVYSMATYYVARAVAVLIAGIAALVAACAVREERGG